MTGVYVEARPFPGHEPAPRPDTAVVAGSALAAARRALLEPSALPVDHPAGCRCSVWCRDEWTYAGQAIGACSVCDEPCRSTDPEGRRRHPNCVGGLS